MSVWVCATYVRVSVKVIKYIEIRGTGDCKPLDKGTGNQTGAKKQELLTTESSLQLQKYVTI